MSRDINQTKKITDNSKPGPVEITRYNRGMPETEKTFAVRADPALWFWIAFVGLNALLTLPYFLFTRTDFRWLPFPGLDMGAWQQLFLAREHPSLLPLNAETSLALAAWVWLAPRWKRSGRAWFWRIFFGCYTLGLVYATYAAVLTGLYHLQPNFYNDYRFLSGGLPFFFDAMPRPVWAFPAVGLGVPALAALIGWGAKKILVEGDPSRLGRLTRTLVGGLALLVLGFGWHYRQAWSDPGMAVYSLGAALTGNLRAAQHAQEAIIQLDPARPFQVYGYARYDLTRKPDIILILFESYGSALYTKEHFRAPYLEALKTFQTRIGSQGWQAASSFSEAPTWGGGSWISYTSALFGLDINQQGQYAAIQDTYQRLPYPNLGRYLQTQGYTYIWVSPIQQRLEPEREQADTRFFGASRWIRLEDMGYQGPLIGWGPSPPDQFTLGYSVEEINSQEQPVFLVTLTQNSHYPYTPLLPIRANWRDFATLETPSDKQHNDSSGTPVFRASRQHYLDAMLYTFQVLGEFITSIEDPDTIIVLLGDHQPPAVSYQGDGYATMLHIISQDPSFLGSLQDYGFSPGMVLESPAGTQAEPGMAHAGFYSLLVRNLVAHYGEAGGALPPYLAQGLDLWGP